MTVAANVHVHARPHVPPIVRRLLPFGGIFGKAQAERRDSQPAPSASVATHTKPQPAGPTRPGTTSTQPSPTAWTGGLPSRPPTLPYASIGTGQRGAPANPTPNGTSARAALPPLMELRSALAQRASNPGSPYHADEVERLLVRSGLARRYPLVVDGLRHGFRMGLPPISVTQTPPNKSSLADFKPHFDGVVASEIQKGRYIGPTSRAGMESLLGPFQTSPLSIIPKPTPGKYRIVQNFSYPHSPDTAFPNPSINSHLDPSDFPCTWGTFMSVAYLIWNLPPGSQMAVRDISEAYRSIPLHRSQWPATVVGLGHGLYCADIFVAFGARPSAGVFGMVADALVDLMRWKGLGPITKWVDDHVFFRIRRRYLDTFNSMRARWARTVEDDDGRRRSRGRLWYDGEVLADGSRAELFEDCVFPLQDMAGDGGRRTERVDDGGSDFPYGLDNVDEFSDTVGLVWEKAKDQAFASTGQYVGLLWDLDSRCVALPSEKKAKYSTSIVEWRSRGEHSLLQVQQLYGRLLHATLVIPAGRARLTGLESMLSFFNNPFALRRQHKDVGPDLVWWSAVLAQHDVSLELGRLFPNTIVDIEAYSDASSGIGIAIIVGGKWRAWRLLPGWQTLDGAKDIQWAEAVGFELLVRSATGSFGSGTHLRLYGDNRGVVEGWHNRRSRNTAVNTVFKRILDHLDTSGFAECIHTSYVPSGDNPADGPSRGVYGPLSQLLPPTPIPTPLRRFIIDATEPWSPAELRHQLHKGTRRMALPKLGSGHHSIPTPSSDDRDSSQCFEFLRDFADF